MSDANTKCLNKIQASGAVLIGGKSRRFGSDKTFISIDGIPLSVILYDRLSEILNEIIFVGDRPDKLQDGRKYMVDLMPDRGPLGGLYSALSAAQEDYCFLTACDLPFMDSALIDYLWSKKDTSNDIIVPIWSGKVEPLAAFYHRRCLPVVKNALLNDQRRMRIFWGEMNVNYVDVTSNFELAELERLFFNVNTPAHYRQAREWMATTG